MSGHIYRIGDRVRIVRARIETQLIGKEATVAAVGLFRRNGATDGIRLDVDGDMDFLCGPDNIEPIQRSDDKSQSTTHDTEIDDLAARVVADLLRKHARELAHG